jgi:hypothetical protein
VISAAPSFSADFTAYLHLHTPIGRLSRAAAAQAPNRGADVFLDNGPHDGFDVAPFRQAVELGQDTDHHTT